MYVANDFKNHCTLLFYLLWLLVKQIFYVIIQATVAAFAASEGHAHPRVIELPKTEDGLGFNVMGGKEQNSPIYISRIIPNGVADRHGALKRGDQLLSINGVVCFAMLLLFYLFAVESRSFFSRLNTIVEEQI